MSSAFEDELLEEKVRTNVFDPVLLRRMLRYALPYKLRILQGTLLVFASAGFAVLPPLLVGAMVDIVFDTGASLPGDVVARALGFLTSQEAAVVRAWPVAQKLVTFGGLFLLLRSLAFVVDWAGGFLLAGLGQRVLLDIRIELFAHLHQLSLAYHQRNPVGRLVNRVVFDVSAMERMFSVAVVMVTKDAVMLVSIVILLLVIDLKLALIVLSVIPFMIAATVIFRRYSRGAYRRWYRAQSRLNAFMAEIIAGVRVVQLYHLEGRNNSRYEKLGGEFLRHFLQQRQAWATFRPVATTLSAVGIGLVLWFCGEAVLRGAGLSAAGMVAIGAISVGVLVSYLQYAELFFTPIRDIAEKFDIVIGAMTGAERVFTILDEQPELQDLPGARDFGRCDGSVEFRDVHFGYNANEPVLRGLNFAIQSGQTVAVVGPTGAGKTTLVSLVSRLYDVQGGQVFVGGRDVRAYTLASLRGQVAVVHQDVFLFAGTIRENLTLGDERIPQERVIAACREIGVHAFIERLPGGYDAVVEEGGRTFSAGERQLLSFARALVFDPAILVLDEATSSIDTHAEELVQAALRRLTKGRTSIVIAHRLSTIQRADTILVMHHGVVAEQGTHQELLARRGLYHKLYQLQYREAGTA